jgi:hypothetical protein
MFSFDVYGPHESRTLYERFWKTYTSSVRVLRMQDVRETV